MGARSRSIESRYAFLPNARRVFPAANPGGFALLGSKPQKAAGAKKSSRAFELDIVSKKTISCASEMMTI